MAEAQEKDNFWLWIGGIIVVTIVLVFVLKSRETEHLASDAIAIQKAEVEKTFAKRKTQNTAVE
jgi:hypothetical protein